jgi:hypothetical protein
MLSSGLYKLTAGYSRLHGVEIGLANPAWSYWPGLFASLPADWPLFRVLDHLAWVLQAGAAILMLLPPTRALGAWTILLIFATLIPFVRLGVLCQLVCLCAVLFFRPGDLGDSLLSSLVPGGPTATSALWIDGVGTLLIGLAVGYLFLLPLAHAGLYYNLLGRRALPEPLQSALERYTNLCGIIIWRVFSVDVINFYVDLFLESPDGRRTLLSRYGRGGSWRFNSVVEAIALTSVFTTLKYHPSNSELFLEKLRRYARTFACPPGSRLVFVHRSILKEDGRFAFRANAEFVWDARTGAVTERALREGPQLREPHSASPVHEGRRPGSYAPLGR